MKFYIYWVLTPTIKGKNTLQMGIIGRLRRSNYIGNLK